MDDNEKIKKLYDAACRDVLSEQGIATGKLSAEDIAGFSDLPLERVKELMQEQSA